MSVTKAVVGCVFGVVVLVGAVLSMSSTVAAQTVAATQWEYLSVDYAQNQIAGTQFDIKAEVTRYETISVSREPYATTFVAGLIDGCNIKDPSILFVDIEAQKCIGKNFKGRDFFLEQLGLDGWELISLDNQSVEYAYHLDLIFKRPKQ